MTNQKQTNLPKTRADILFLSWFGSGFSPWAPGTIGSFATIPILVGFNYYTFSLFIHISCVLFFTVLACFLAQRAQQEFNLKDPGWIVIDEVLGMWVCYLFYQPNTLLGWGLLFFLFRIFDIIKVPPAKQFDEWNHGIGTIMDDIISGIYTGFVLLIIKNFFQI